MCRDCITQMCGFVAFHANDHYAGHGPSTVKLFWTRLAVSGEPEGYTGLGEILPSAGYMARLAVAVA